MLRIDSKPGKVVKPDAVKMIQGEGMPYHGNPFSKGRLFVHFRVEFPTSITKVQLRLLPIVVSFW